ncbi:MAG: sulfotransferase [Marmoricola sp.]
MTKILYIAGWGRSGTTLMDSVLGQVDGIVSTGELHNLWQRGLVDGRDCGCGLRLRDCEFWSRVFDLGFGGIGKLDPRAAIQAQSSMHTRHVLDVMRAQKAGRTMQDVAYAPHLKRLYDGIAKASQARVIVDSSKYPVDAIVAAGLPGYEVYVVHMVRDPRAVAYSWSRRKDVRDKATGGGILPRVGMLRSTVVWQLYNSVIATADRRVVGRARYLRLSYEEFASRPEEVLTRVLELVGERPSDPPLINDSQVELSATHSAGGNPDRFRSGKTTIRLDSAWKANMSPLRQVAVALLASPTWLVMCPSRKARLRAQS